MGHIYRQAAGVVIYLGEGIEDLDLTRYLLLVTSEAAQENDQQQAHMKFHTSYFSNQESGQPVIPPAYAPEWDTLHDFFRRPYFSRVWALQEVILASTDPTVLCNDWKLDSSEIFQAAALYQSSGLRRAPTAPDQSFHAVLMAECRFALKSVDRKHRDMWNLL
ncbi:hypothetical protein K432DRAFT_403340 [Lepidopterella palustris CBS 459.81]|uniref:Heterokaryon incompatibility domain-containing protein n=1 Tax=Lepidopterella palustris CBS 459.81 TaxID=1314670 RepID=A0A8E2EDQ8_9PEZI|nr:hypothetical protein K432DRAFT_403340 [Lepidopterella palustris CBS 459.81]